MSSLPASPPASTRRRLPNTRPSITVKRTICGSEYYITVGFYDDPTDGPRDTPAELFIKCPHHGSVTAGLIDGLCTAMSVAWQYGVPWEVNRSKFVGTRFGHADIHEGVEQTSFLDGLAKAIDGIILERRKVTGEDCPSVNIDWLKPECKAGPIDPKKLEEAGESQKTSLRAGWEVDGTKAVGGSPADYPIEGIHGRDIDPGTK